MSGAPHPKPEPRPKRDRAWGSTLPKASAPMRRSTRLANGSAKPKVRARKVEGPGVDAGMRAEVFRRARGFCQADGLHHPDCPGRLPALAWQAHHIQPRSKGGADELENLLALWAPTLGASGCHGRVHSRPALAKELGLLRGREVA